MDRLDNFAHTYTQAPWRKQFQIMGLFLLGVVLAALVAAVYLTVSARTAAAGREIQYMDYKIGGLNTDIEDLQAQLALILSSEEMEKRARSLGFEPVSADDIVYLAIPGYVEAQPAVLAPYLARTVVSAPVTPAEYTESIFTWLSRQIRLWLANSTEVLP
ncbi:MAG: hypothetical protein JXB15_15555 [Anaerolineales bacterium]|nr:hypothetical protein [Anaerolineales bacterium]